MEPLHEPVEHALRGLEYTVDLGLTWHPSLYLIDRDDIIRGANGATDAIALR